MVNPLPDGRPNPNVLCCLPRPASMISAPNILEITNAWKVIHDSPFPRVVIPLTDMGTIECHPLQKQGGSETENVYRGIGSGVNHRLIIPTGGPFQLKATTAGRAVILDCPVPEVLGFFTSPATLPSTAKITMSAPGVVATGAASALAVAANPNRRFLYIKNPDAAKTQSLAFDGNAAVGGSGVVLGPGDAISFHSPGEAPTTGQVNAISPAGASTIAFQEGV